MHITRYGRLLPFLLLGGVTALFAEDGKGKDKDNDDDEKFEFALIGDAPYGPTSGVSPTKVQVYPSPEYNNVIQDINNTEKVKFTIHAGDIKAGDTLCRDDVYTNNLALFNTFKRPLVYAIGDNEWTDCHRANNGSYNPTERLSFLRGMFFPANKSLGQQPMTLMRQSDDPAHSLYRENVMWRRGPALFVVINQPGSNNNRNRTTGVFQDADAEYTARNAANLAWIDKAFAMAAADSGIKGILIAQQSNPFERFVEAGQGYTVSGYADFIKKLRNSTIASGKQVVLVNGDTHYCRVDKPLTETYPACTAPTGTCVPVAAGGLRIENFARAEVFAQADVHWIKATVDPHGRSLFVFEPMIVPANVKPHPIVP
ncbi:MAG: hypothetical protein HY013_02935 [Candidatus Solibacter usitatus]|nr:hypothetical protein [Candidatus Solibacter usitatus]